MPDIDLRWIEELLAPSSKYPTLMKYRVWNILGRAAEVFVKEIFEKLDYRVTPDWRERGGGFDLIAEKKSKRLLIEIKLRIAGAGFGSAAVLSEISREIQETRTRYEFYLVSFDRSKDVNEYRIRFKKYFPEGFKFHWVSVEDLLGLSNRAPQCGRLERTVGLGLLQNWRNKMVHSTAEYFEGKGLTKAKEIATSVIKLADGNKELVIDDFDIMRTLSEKIMKKDPSYFESLAFFCEVCNKRSRRVNVVWSERKKKYVLLCSECRKKIEKVQLQVPIKINIQWVMLDTSAIIEGAISKLINQRFFQAGAFIIIPEVVDQELELMEKPNASIPKEIKDDLRRKFGLAEKEVQRLTSQDLSGLIKLKRHVGDRLDQKKLESKIRGVDRHVSDRLLVESCKQMGALLITKDEGLATRAAADKINVFLLS